MFDKLTEYITEGKAQDALYELQEEYLYLDEKAPADRARFYILEATIWEMLGDGASELDSLYKALSFDPTNYEIYYMLGLFYRDINVNRACVCMEMALGYCTLDEDRQIIESSFDEIKRTDGVRVRNTSIMILSYNDLSFLKRCIAAIEEYVPAFACEIVVVDNASGEEGVREYLKEKEKDCRLPFKLILSDENLGFPKGCNLGAANCERDNDIFFLNNDAVLMPLSFFFLRMGLYGDRNVGAVGALSNSASLQEVSAEKLPRVETSIDKFREITGKRKIDIINPYIPTFRLTGFALIVSRDALDTVARDGKVFDEVFSPGYFEDDDLGIRISKAGYRQLVCKNSYIYHNGGDGFEGHSDAMEVGRNKFINKWGFDVWGYSLPWTAVCDEVLRIAEEKKGIVKVLDFTCGLGANASYIKGKRKNVYIAGVCASSFAYAIAGNIADEVAFGEANTARLPFEDKSFDVVIAERAHVSMGQIGRYLKSDGIYLTEREFPF